MTGSLLVNRFLFLLWALQSVNAVPKMLAALSDHAEARAALEAEVRDLRQASLRNGAKAGDAPPGAGFDVSELAEVSSGARLPVSWLRLVLFVCLVCPC